VRAADSYALDLAQPKLSKHLFSRSDGVVNGVRSKATISDNVIGRVRDRQEPAAEGIVEIHDQEPVFFKDPQHFRKESLLLRVSEEVEETGGQDAFKDTVRKRKAEGIRFNKRSFAVAPLP